jgi:hypothetical protein
VRGGRCASALAGRRHRYPHRKALTAAASASTSTQGPRTLLSLQGSTLGLPWWLWFHLTTSRQVLRLMSEELM